MKILDVINFFKDTRPALKLYGLPCVNRVLLNLTLLSGPGWAKAG